MSSVTRVRPKCSYGKACPWQFQPEAHVCVARDELWHTCGRNASHQHHPRRNHAGSKIVAIVCLPLHGSLDQGFPHTGRDGVKRRIENTVEETWMCNSELGRVELSDGPRCEDCEDTKRWYVIRERGPSGKELFRIPLPKETDGR